MPASAPFIIYMNFVCSYWLFIEGDVQRNRWQKIFCPQGTRVRFLQKLTMFAVKDSSVGWTALTSVKLRNLYKGGEKTNS